MDHLDFTPDIPPRPAELTSRGESPQSIRSQGTPPASIPAPEERGIAKIRQQYEAEVHQRAQLITSGNRALTTLYEDTIDLSFSGISRSVKKLEDMDNPTATQICSQIFKGVTNDYTIGMIEHFRLGEAAVKGVTTRSLEPPKSQPKPTIIESRPLKKVEKDERVTIIDALRGKKRVTTWEPD